MKTKFLKLLAVMTISITAIFALGITASAATAGDFTITLTEGGGNPVVGTDYTYAGGVLTILSDKDITIKNANPSTSTTNRIEVADGISANITLAGVNIDVSSQSDTAAFKIADDSTGNVTITIADGKTNTLKSGKNCAGLQKNGEYISETQGKLTITGICSLIAPGGAGIGGDISSSTITAIGGEGGAGIGGGYRGSGSNITITISGGKVTATGGDYGAGIGGGFSSGFSSGSYITISDGTVIATGGECGAGIGGGSVGSGSNIKISGGTVTATGGECGAGIGCGGFGCGGFGGGVDNITISGGSVKAVAGEKYEYDGTTYFPAAIGQGVQYDSNTDVHSNGAEVTPTDGNGNNVCLLELTSATSSLKIDGKGFPINHGSDGKVYVYLPEGEHTVISDENSTTNKYAKKADNKLEAIGTAFTITGTGLVYGTDYTYPASTGVLTILSGKAMTIANVNPNTATTDRIEVALGISANITLAGVNIDVSSQSDTAAFKIADNSAGNVTITL
ncbi:MAG: hypothetical protein J6A41_06820, partial [Ruminiclostridium sp.]|nr:hypothetical protein [Ruminiclostridium sp.]